MAEVMSPADAAAFDQDLAGLTEHVEYIKSVYVDGRATGRAAGDPWQMELASFAQWIATVPDPQGDLIPRALLVEYVALLIHREVVRDGG